MTGTELRAIRESLGLPQAALAQKLGVTVTTVSRWETGQRPTPSFLGLALKGLQAEVARGKTKR